MIGVIYAIIAAILFGISTPFAKMLGTDLSPLLLAGTLYLGSGLGLSLIWFFRHQRIRHQAHADTGYLKRKDLPWFAGAVIAGGAIGPFLLMHGLKVTSSSTASLLLNLEGVLTAALAWFVFGENRDRRIVAGMCIIVCAGVILGFEPHAGAGEWWGMLAITGACLCWAIDNNLTRKVSASDAVQIACIKGLFAGTINIGLAFLGGQTLPDLPTLTSALCLGFFSYGISLVCFVLALRHLGTARTGAYFSSAPFVGVMASLVFLGEQPGTIFWIACILMLIGLALHLTEIHEHMHSHEPMTHTHSHVHDEHHQHSHSFAWDGKEPHTHEHAHVAMQHTHPHYPDIHHQHGHK